MFGYLFELYASNFLLCSWAQTIESFTERVNRLVVEMSSPEMSKLFVCLFGRFAETNETKQSAPFGHKQIVWTTNRRGRNDNEQANTTVTLSSGITKLRSCVTNERSWVIESRLLFICLGWLSVCLTVLDLDLPLRKTERPYVSCDSMRSIDEPLCLSCRQLQKQTNKYLNSAHTFRCQSTCVLFAFRRSCVELTWIEITFALSLCFALLCFV